jgi:hypothetical protein
MEEITVVGGKTIINLKSGQGGKGPKGLNYRDWFLFLLGAWCNEMLHFLAGQ